MKAKECLILHCKRGSSSVGRASASQAEGHEFEPRLPLIAESRKVELLLHLRHYIPSIIDRTSSAPAYRPFPVRYGAHGFQPPPTVLSEPNHVDWASTTATSTTGFNPRAHIGRDVKRGLWCPEQARFNPRIHMGRD